MPKRKIALLSITITLIVGISAFAVKAASDTNKSQKIATVNRSIEIPKGTEKASVVNRKVETIWGTENTKNNVPFEIKSIRGNKVKVTKITDKLDIRNEEGRTSYIVDSYYKTADGGSIALMQTKDTGRPVELSQSEKIKINGINAWIYMNTQVLFWKDGMYYNLTGNVRRDTLIQLAEDIK